MPHDLEKSFSLSHHPIVNTRNVFPVLNSDTLPYIPPETQRRSLLIPLIVLANVSLFFVTMYINDCPRNTAEDKCVAKFLGRFSFQPLTENPLFGPASRVLQRLGGLDTNKIVHDHQGWRLFTCTWLHAGVVHIFANMLSLLLIGIKLEQEFGFSKIGILYVLSGMGGNLLSSLFLESRISVGASGALFGLLGAMLSELITNWTIHANKCAALVTLIFVAAFNLSMGVLPHVDNFAHIGGFLVGFLLGFVLLLRPQFGWMDSAHIPTGYELRSPTSKHKLYQYVLFAIALLILVAGFLILSLFVFEGVDGNEKCTWCHYLSCMPTSKWKCAESNTTCDTITTGNNMVMTCLNNNKSLSTSAGQSNFVLQELCSQLCL